MPTAFELTARTLRHVYGYWIHTPAILDADELFPEARILERKWRTIRDEALSLLGELDRIPLFHDLMEDQASISANDGHYWRMFLLRAYGSDQEANMARCPETARLVRSIPSITSAGFSLLEQGKHIPSHRGPYRGIMRYQLGLRVPHDENGEPQAVLRVADQRYRWREGEGILWDDTYDHEVWNEGDGPRIILLIDVVRPDMPLVPRALHKVIYGGVARSKSLRKVLARSEVPAPLQGREARTP